MRSILKSLILLLMVAALPLRGYAALAAELCATHHGGSQSVHSAEHDHHDGHAPDGHDGDHPLSASVCSHCASCSVGASLAPDVARRMAILPRGADRIPFFGVRTPGFVPDHLDRPPLAL